MADSSVLTHAIIASAIEQVDSYRTAADGLFEELQGVINALTASDFVGDAANGYKEFFTTKITPALTEQLSAPQGSLLAGIKSMLEGIQAQLMDTVDPQLGDSNRNPGA